MNGFSNFFKSTINKYY